MALQSITVFTKPNCYACDSTKKHLDKLRDRGLLLIPYMVQPIGPAILESAAAAGVTSAPIVEARYDTYTHLAGGYRPDRLDQLARHSRGEA